MIVLIALKNRGQVVSLHMNGLELQRGEQRSVSAARFAPSFRTAAAGEGAYLRLCQLQEKLDLLRFLHVAVCLKLKARHLTNVGPPVLRRHPASGAENLPVELQCPAAHPPSVFLLVVEEAAGRAMCV